MKKIILTFFIILTCHSIHAAAISYIGFPNSNGWNDPANWSTGTIPGVNDDVTIIGNTPLQFIQTFNGLDVNVRSLKIENVSFVTTAYVTTNAFIPGTTNSFEVKNSELQTNAALDVYGGMSIDNSSVVHNSNVRFLGNIDGTLYNVSLKDSDLTVLSNGFLPYLSLNNMQPLGGRTDVFMKADNSTIINETDLFGAIPVTASNTGPPLKGMILENNSMFINKAKVLLWDVDVVGIELLTGSTYINEIGSELTVEYCVTCPTSNPDPGIIQNTGCLFSDLGSTTISRFGGIILLANIFVPSSSATYIMSGTLASGYSIFGSGSISLGSNGAINGTVAPGSSPGVFTFVDEYEQPGSTLGMEIAGNGSAGALDGFDQIIFEGAINDINDVNLDVVLLDNFTPQVGDQYTIIDAGSNQINNGFNVINFPGDDSSWGITYTSNSVIIELIAPLSNAYNVGIGTSDPKKKLHVKDGDVYIETLGSGLILKDANGNCRKITIDGLGAITAPIIPCPN